ncbi:MAG: hypothetical protein HY005_03335 [Candidatus Staskawiczbacteria bacterium]|nr:hypothetical protein [Candidatus Staskawiczbacteria bacterium]MBI3337622.1 hypothetical protein [Candidatus Staskawiczbacteria bacterium]
MKKIAVGLLLLSVLLVPVTVFAQPNVTISSLDQLVNAIKRPIWIVFGLIALIAFVVAGILFLSAGGDPEKVKTARAAFLWGIVGIVVGIVAFSIVTIIETAL